MLKTKVPIKYSLLYTFPATVLPLSLHVIYPNYMLALILIGCVIAMAPRVNDYFLKKSLKTKVPIKYLLLYTFPATVLPLLLHVIYQNYMLTSFVTGYAIENAPRVSDYFLKKSN